MGSWEWASSLHYTMSCIFGLHTTEEPSFEFVNQTHEQTGQRFQSSTLAILALFVVCSWGKVGAKHKVENVSESYVCCFLFIIQASLLLLHQSSVQQMWAVTNPWWNRSRRDRHDKCHVEAEVLPNSTEKETWDMFECCSLKILTSSHTSGNVLEMSTLYLYDFVRPYV